MAIKNESQLVLDYRSKTDIPQYVKEIIEARLAIEAEDAKSAGALGFMSRALVIATMPYKDPKADAFVRRNGDFTLRIVAGYEGGIPFGIYPRLLMSWVATEAVRTESPVIELGDSLSAFMRDVLELRGRSGGARGSVTRVNEQMRRLFGSMVTAQFNGTQDKRGFNLRNVLIAEEYEEEALDPDQLWTPQEMEQAGQWRSKVRLTNKFYQECVTNPVPIDLRAYKALRKSPLAMDVYTWLSYRMSYTQRKSRPIPWESLQMQFGSGYAFDAQGKRDFKKSFLSALGLVQIVYPEAKFQIPDNGLVLLPSPPHIPHDRQKTFW